MKTLAQIKDETNKLGICSNEDECVLGENFREEDRTIFNCYCKGEYRLVRDCDYYQMPVTSEMRAYYMDQRLKRIEEALKLPEE